MRYCESRAPAVAATLVPASHRRYNELILASQAQPRPSLHAASATARHGEGFLLGVIPDLMLLGPGATILLTGVFLALLSLGQAQSAALLATALTVAFSGPHYAATYRRAYSSVEIIRAHPLVTLGAPLLLAGGAVAAVALPTTFAPAYFLTYVVWSGYHYSGQSLGLAMLYPLRQGERLSVREKRLLSLPLLVSWGLSLLGLLRIEGSVRNSAYQIVRDVYFTARLPAWGLVLGMAALVASFAGVAVVARSRSKRGIPLPWPCYGVLLAQVIWFGVGLFYPFFNIFLVPIFHALQYLALTSWHQCKGHGERGPRLFVVYALTVLGIGLLINPGFLLVAGGGSGDTLVATAAVVTFVNLHHFLLDGRIWRLRERRVVESFVSPPAVSRS